MPIVMVTNQITTNRDGEVVSTVDLHAKDEWGK